MIVHQFVKANTFDKIVAERTVEGGEKFICVEYRDGWYNFYYFVEVFQGWATLRGVINHSEEEALKEFDDFVEGVIEFNKVAGYKQYYENLKEK